MQQQYFNKLKELLLKLKINEGYFVIETAYVDVETNSESVVYCQLIKNDKEDPIRFEALSHYFNELVDDRLENRFFALGFTLLKDENYTKNILLNSDFDINNTALEIGKIFEELYNVNELNAYDFDDQVENIKSNLKDIQKVNSTNVHQLNQTQSKHKIGVGVFFVIVVLIFWGYFTFFDTEKESASSHKEAVFNNELDASVYQVEDYLKNEYLNDANSYQPITWSAVFKLNNTKEVGFPSYQVRHKYRAKNGFGGYVIEEKLFKLDYQGNIVDMQDYLR